MITWSVAKPHEIGALSRWVAELIWPGRARDFGNCQGLAVMENDVLIAGMIYHNFEPDAGVVEISGAGTTKRWLTKETLRVLFQIPFKDWGCQAVVMRISDHDPTLQSILKRYGFEQYVIPRLRGRDENENVFVLTDEAWANNKFNRKADVSAR
jgi:hypothetical protein